MWLEHSVPSQIKETSIRHSFAGNKKGRGNFLLLKYHITRQGYCSTSFFFSFLLLKECFCTCWNLCKCSDMNTTRHRWTCADSPGPGFPRQRWIKRTVSGKAISTRNNEPARHIAGRISWTEFRQKNTLPQGKILKMFWGFLTSIWNM